MWSGGVLYCSAFLEFTCALTTVLETNPLFILYEQAHSSPCAVGMRYGGVPTRVSGKEASACSRLSYQRHVHFGPTCINMARDAIRSRVDASARKSVWGASKKKKMQWTF